MEILITNDDGIGAEGLGVLARAAREIGRVTIVAPEKEQSASSHAITLGAPLRIRRRGEREFSVDGTPTDCVFLAWNGLLERRPDLVLAGVNHGANMGEDVTYSGTVAAAMEAAILRIPAIAFSVEGREEIRFDGPREMIAGLVRRMIDDPLPPRSFWNVNFPNVARREIRGTRVTHLGSREYRNSVFRGVPEGKDQVFTIGGGDLAYEKDTEADFFAVLDDRFVSLTPLCLDMNDYDTFTRWRHREWRLDDDRPVSGA